MTDALANVGLRRPAYLPPMDRAVWSNLHGRPWLLTGRQYAFLVRLSHLEEWFRLTQRELAGYTGYSLKGAHRTIGTLRAGGLIAVRTRRGRKGGTWLAAVKGLLAMLHRNVSPVVRRSNVESESVPTLGNISPREVYNGPDWASLGPILKALALGG